MIISCTPFSDHFNGAVIGVQEIHDLPTSNRISTGDAIPILRLDETDNVSIIYEESTSGITPADLGMDSQSPKHRFRVSEHSIPVHGDRRIDDELDLVYDRLASLGTDPDGYTIHDRYVRDEVHRFENRVVQPKKGQIDIEVETHESCLNLSAVRQQHRESIGVTSSHEMPARHHQIGFDSET